MRKRRTSTISTEYLGSAVLVRAQDRTTENLEDFMRGGALNVCDGTGDVTIENP